MVPTRLLDDRGGARWRRVLPVGTPLPDDVWLARHRVLSLAAWLTGGAAALWATLERGPVHGLVDSLPVALALLVALVAGPGVRRAAGRRRPARS